MEKETLKQLQECLDLQKYYTSLSKNQDLTGKMQYCKDCLYNKNNECLATQNEREIKYLCAKNRNKNEKAKKNKKAGRKNG